MKNINPMDEAQLKHEMRIMYREVGFEGAIQVLYEITLSAEILLEVVREEFGKETKDLES